MILRSNQLPRFHSSLSPCWHFQLSNFCIKSGHVNESRKPLSIQRIQSLRKPLERTNRESPIEKINRESPIEKINRESPLEKFNRESRSSSSGVKSDSFLSKWIENFNCTVAVHADTSLVTYLLFRSATWYALAAIYSQILTVGPELALGYVITRFTGRLRLPFNVGLAAIISNQFPIFGTIQASALLGLMKRNANEAHTEKSPFELQLERFQKWIEGPLDQYGFSYLIASKLNVMVSICGTAYAVKIGLDVPSLLVYLGVTETIQNGAGAMAAATLTNIVLMPAHLTALTYMSPFIDVKLKTTIQSLRDKFESSMF